MIKFFSEKDKYGELSNFFDLKSCFFNRGQRYSSSEHAFQAQKYLQLDASAINIEYSKVIGQAKTAYMSKLLANQSKDKKFVWQKSIVEQVERYVSEGIHFRQDWEEVKEEIMRDIIHEKFGQSDHCRKVLLSTAGYFLEEASPHDSFWGIGKFGNGIWQSLTWRRRERLCC